MIGCLPHLSCVVVVTEEKCLGSPSHKYLSTAATSEAATEATATTETPRAPATLYPIMSFCWTCFWQCFIWPYQQTVLILRDLLVTYMCLLASSSRKMLIPSGAGITWIRLMTVTFYLLVRAGRADSGGDAMTWANTAAGKFFTMHL